MKIYKVFKNGVISQGYGAKNTNPSVMHFYIELGMKGHNGWDWMATDGQKIYWDCSERGTVVSISEDLNAGYGVEVLTNEDGKIFKHRFWHLRTDGIKCKVGQVLESGDLIGLADNTGKYTTGTHLHRDLKECAYQTNGVLTTLNPGNGYLGNIDLTPYFQDIFVLDYLDNLRGQISILQKLIDLYKQLIGKR